MAVERLAPSTFFGVPTNLSGPLANIVDDPDSPDGLWLTAVDSTLSTEAAVGFPSASGELTGAQTIRARVRRVGGTANPTCRIEVRRLGVLIAQTTELAVSSATGQVLQLSWTGLEPDQIRAVIVGTASGGNPSKRATVEVGAVEWNAQYVVASPDRSAVVSWAEIEAPAAPRSASVSFAEMETGNAPRSAALAWAELEAPEPPADQSVSLSWAELEAPDVPVSIDRAADLSWGELEVPTAPRFAAVAWAELEAGTPPGSAQVAWAVVEVPSIGAPPPTGPRRGTITMMGVGA